MSDYTGGLNNNVFSYLDSLSREIRPYDTSPREEQGYTKQLPDHQNLSNLERECGVKLFKGLSDIMENAPKGTAKQKIKELHAQLREEYPRFSHYLKC